MPQRTPPEAGQLSLDVGDLGGARGGYRGPAVCEIVGITYRQLDYWARTGLVEPSVRKATGSGTQRLYAFEDLVRLRVVKRMLDAGIDLKKIRVAVEELHARGRSLADATLVAAGGTVLLVEDDAEVLDLVRRGQAVLALSLDPLVEELRGDVAPFPTERIEPADEAPDATAAPAAPAADAAADTAR